MIGEFRGEFRWLSNFWPAQFDLDGATYSCVEQWYVWNKLADPADRAAVLQLALPGEMKRLGERRPVSPDWTAGRRLAVMRRGVLAKFAQNPDLRALLLATGDEPLREGNRWGDTFWGADLATGAGENWLGRVLMETRDALAR